MGAPGGVGLATGFRVFLLPFFLPPELKPALSVSFAAGFNNKVAAVSAALCAVVVFLASLRPASLSSSRDEEREDFRLLPWAFWTGAALFVGVCVSAAAWAVHVSRMRYAVDAGYFINQMQSAAVYHRHLYSEIELPYGPLLFYPPIWLYGLLGKLYLSLRACYFVVLVIQQVAGILLVVYLVNVLPMSRKWKYFAVCCFAVFTIQPLLGLNYTLFRFAIPLATLLFSIRQKRPWMTMLLFGAGEVLNLAVSAEMGFAFGAGAVAYCALQMYLSDRVWGFGCLTVFSGIAVFLLFAGRPYLTMLSLFAGGAFNFIVEPLPHVLLLLVAMVWLVPRMLALRWAQQHGDVAMLGAAMVLSAALVPVALGRADPAHVFFNGLGIFPLAMVALSGSARWRQMTWAVCFMATMLMGLSRIYVLLQIPIGQVVRRDGRIYRESLPVRSAVAVARHVSKGAVERFDGPQFAPEPAFDVAALEALVGKDIVAIPFEVSLQAEEALRQGGHYRPSFYSFMYGIVDQAAERRKMRELNEAPWAMLPTGPGYMEAATQEQADVVLGIALPYRMKHKPYTVGVELAQNLKERWRPVGTVNDYTIYRNTRVEPAIPLQ